MTDRPTNPGKASRVEELKRLISHSKSLAVVDYTGMSVAHSTKLRQDLKKTGGEMKIEKNTLFRIALGQPDLKLEGLSAFVFSNSDEISAIKTTAEFSKKAGVLKFKMGLLGNRLLTAEEIESLAKIPSKTALIQSLLSTLQSPIFGLAYSLNWNVTKLVRTLSAISQKGVN